MQNQHIRAFPMGDDPHNTQAVYNNDLLTSSIHPPPASDADETLNLAGQLYSSIRQMFRSMTSLDNGTCVANCSGRGECQEGICLCQVQYNGDSCTDPNLAYFISFATIFYTIALISIIQLCVCIRSEYQRMKAPSLRSACVITTQKLLYIITFIGATLRGAYFSSPANADLQLSSSFRSAFYPIILTAASLIVCFWAEAFHLRDIRCDRPRFLSKSICGFLTFNFVTYSLFITDIILTKETDSQEERSFLNHIFNGCYAVLLFVVVVFFLIYGVEVYFKVRGGFVSDTIIVSNVHSRVRPQATDRPLLDAEVEAAESRDPVYVASDPSNDSVETNKKIECVVTETAPESHPLVNEQLHIFTGLMPKRGVDQSQLHQSRFGLVFQAFMLLIIVCFLWSDVLGELWKNKVQLVSRNAYDVLFRVVEIAVALWFPCVLWNCISPEQLWILNPKKILKKLDFEKTLELGHSQLQAESGSRCDLRECWICYDAEATDFGPLIFPCDCKGDVGAVHHNCLRKWLMECASSTSEEQLACKVCGSPYQLERKKVWWIGKGFTARQWLHTASLVTVMCATIAGLWAAIQLCEGMLIHASAVGITLIIFNICLRLLGFNVFSAYERAKMSAVKILGGRFNNISTASTEEETAPTVVNEVVSEETSSTPTS